MSKTGTRTIGFVRALGKWDLVKIWAGILYFHCVQQLRL